MEIRVYLPVVITIILIRVRTQDRAYEASQKYKEGKYILERNLLVDVQ